MIKLLNNIDEISQDKKVIIDFFAEWCGPCKKIAPQYIELSKKFTDIDFYKCNVDETSELSEQFDVNALPTFVFLLNGKVVNKLEGADIEGLKKLIEDLNNSESKEISVTTQKEECCANKEECGATQKEDSSSNKNNCSKASCGCIS